MTDALVLHLFDYLESSRIVRVATRELGVQSVLARGDLQSEYAVSWRKVRGGPRVASDRRSMSSPAASCNSPRAPAGICTT